MIATDLPAKPYPTASSDASINNPSVCASTLDDSFAAIDWQAPWLCHLNQLGYISKAITKLSSLRDNSAQTDKLENTPDIIAKVLNSALQKHADDLQQPLPQTKPALNRSEERRVGKEWRSRWSWTDDERSEWE